MTASSAVLLMAYGSPATLEEVEPYYTHIRGGRRPTPEQVEALRARYRAIGGASPLLGITRAQAEALAARLGIPVYVGMKHWHPFIEETVERMHGDGVARAVAIALAPHYSRMSIGGYISAVEAAVTRFGGPQMTYVESWHLHPLFVDAVVERVRDARRLADPQAPVVFTAHSLPKRILEWGDPYVDQLVETARTVAHAAEVGRWSFAFQSASATGEPWLGPDILDVIREVHGTGVREVVVCPIGFVADHLEVLYDIDVEGRRLAEGLGMRLTRTESLNASPPFIEALAVIVREHFDGASTAANGPRVLVVIPLFNEEATLTGVLAEVRRAAPLADILVVNDGSTDRSAAILEVGRARDPRLQVIARTENLGYGQSLIDGFATAVARGYDAVVTIDCDAQHEPRQIPQFLAALAEADIVSGSRYLDPAIGGDPAPPDRLAINRETTDRLRELTGYPLTDAWCGFKVYRVDVLRRLELTEPGYGMPLQVWIQAARLGLRVKELPVPRIYKNPERRFWGGLDDAETRRRYYQDVLERELERSGRAGQAGGKRTWRVSSR